MHTLHFVANLPNFTRTTLSLQCNEKHTPRHYANFVVIIIFISTLIFRTENILPHFLLIVYGLTIISSASKSNRCFEVCLPICTKTENVPFRCLKIQSRKTANKTQQTPCALKISHSIIMCSPAAHMWVKMYIYAKSNRRKSARISKFFPFEKNKSQTSDRIIVLSEFVKFVWVYRQTYALLRLSIECASMSMRVWALSIVSADVWSRAICVPLSAMPTRTQKQTAQRFVLDFVISFFTLLTGANSRRKCINYLSRARRVFGGGSIFTIEQTVRETST